jgi:hypothetical protein
MRKNREALGKTLRTFKAQMESLDGSLNTVEKAFGANDKSAPIAKEILGRVREGLVPLHEALAGFEKASEQGDKVLAVGEEQFGNLEKLLESIGVRPAVKEEEPKPSAEIVAQTPIKISTRGTLPLAVRRFIEDEWKKLNPKPKPEEEVKEKEFEPSEEEMEAAEKIVKLVGEKYGRKMEAFTPYRNGKYPGQKDSGRKIETQFNVAYNRLQRARAKLEKGPEAGKRTGPQAFQLPVANQVIVPENQRVYLASDCYVTVEYVRKVVSHVKGGNGSIQIEDGVLMSLLQGGFQLKGDLSTDPLKPVRDALIKVLNERGVKANAIDGEGIVVSAGA